MASKPAFTNAGPTVALSVELWIDFNANKGKEATRDFDKSLYKLMNNGVYATTCVNEFRKPAFITVFRFGDL